MAGVAAVVTEFFAGDALAAAGTEALAAGGAYAAGTAEITAGALAGVGAGAGEAAIAGTALAGSEAAFAGAAVAGGAAAGSGVLGNIGTNILTGIGTSVASSLLLPTPQFPSGGAPGQQPKTLAPSSMPDPLAQQAAKTKAIAEQTTRRGRASTVLTSPGNSSGHLGG